MNGLNRTVLVWIVLSACLPWAYCQEQTSEADIQLQEKFIDAKRELLIGNVDKAIPLLQQILKEDKSNHAAAFELARAFHEKEQEDEAVKWARTAVSLAPENSWYARFLAELFQHSGRNKEAADIYAALVKREPYNELYYQNWAYYLVRANEIEEALNVYDELEKKAGLSEEIIRRKHSLYLGIGNNKKAAKELERLIEAFPNNTDYRHLLASFYQQIGERELAHSVFQDILAIDPDDARAKIGIVGTPKNNSDDLTYLESLRPVFQNAEVPIDLKLGKIIPIITKVAETEDRELGLAALDLTTILETVHPDEAKAFSASADLLYYTGNREKALEKYEKTLKLDESVFLVWEQVMNIHLESRNYQALLRSAEEVMNIFPNKALSYYMSGVSYQATERPKEALSVLQQALLMAGNNPPLVFDIQTILGLTYFDLGKYPESDAAFEAALKLNPKSAPTLNLYVYHLALRGEKLPQALEMAEVLNQLAPNQASYQATYGWVFYKMKDFRNARKWMSIALEKGGDQDPVILEHYGDILFQLNDLDNALNYWNQALEKGSRSKLLEKKISDKRLYE